MIIAALYKTKLFSFRISPIRDGSVHTYTSTQTLYQDRVLLLGAMDKRTLERKMEEQDRELEEFMKQRNRKTKTRRKSKIGSFKAMMGDLSIGCRASTAKRDM